MNKSLIDDLTLFVYENKPKDEYKAFNAWSSKRKEKISFGDAQKIIALLKNLIHSNPLILKNAARIIKEGI